MFDKSNFDNLHGNGDGGGGDQKNMFLKTKIERGPKKLPFKKND